MNVRCLSILLSLAALQWGGTLQAQEGPGKNLNPDEIRRSAVEAHKELERQFADFEKQIQVLKNRLERSPNIEDKDRAVQLQKVLDRAQSSQIRIKFVELQEHLRKPTFTLEDYQLAVAKNELLAKDLANLVELFDGQNNRLGDEIDRLKQALKDLEKILNTERTLRSLTEIGKTDPKEAKNLQDNTAKETNRLAQDLDKVKTGEAGKPGSGGDPKVSQSTPKDGGSGKGGDKGQGKEGGQNPGQAKDNKDDMDKNSKPAEAKKDDGNKSPSDANAKNDSKSDSKSSAGKSSNADSMPSDAKGSGLPGEAKPSDSSPSVPPESPPFPPTNFKPMPPGPPMAPGRPTDDPTPIGKIIPSDDDGDGGSASPLDPSDSPIGKKSVLEAYDRMKEAAKKIGDNDPTAPNAQGMAIEQLEKAKKDLEQRLKLLRDEEMERILAALKVRCEKMLAMQIDVLKNAADGTEATYRAIQSNSDKKPTDANLQASLKLSSKEKDIIVEVDKCLEILRGDSTGVAFPVAFEQVKADMINVRNRFDVGDVGLVNQEIQKDIIASLQDMIEALKKKEMDLKIVPPGPPMDPMDKAPPPDPSLLQRIAELKMIRAMQDRLNKRTEMYSKLFPGQEQPSDPNVRREVSELRQRQEQIFDVTNKISKGENK